MSKHTKEFEKEAGHEYVSAAPQVIKGGTAGAPSVLIAYGPEARERVARYRGHAGHFIELNTERKEGQAQLI